MSAVAVAAGPYRECERLTRARARNFYYGIRLLRPDRRAALCAVYALARRIDDIADGPDPAEARLAGLARVEADLAALGSPTDDSVMLAVADAAGRFPIPLSAFGDLLEGARMDVCGVRFTDADQLIAYCRRVAGSIGRLSLGVFGGGSAAAAGDRADDLGVAMQLTNILRDVGDDLAAGRVYLPDGDLARFGCRVTAGELIGEHTADLVRYEAARAHAWFARGRRLLPLIDRSSATCVAVLAGIYEQVLARIELHPAIMLQSPPAVPARVKLWVVARAVAGART